MSYLGKVDMNDANIKHYSLTGSTLTTVNIGWTPASEQSLRVTINGVVQQGDTFSYSGANLTLGGPLIVTDTLEVVGIESVGNIITPADNSVTTAKLADDSVTLAKMAGGTDGNLITYDASGDPAHVATGSATHVLTSNGAGAAPTFQAVAAGGKILQVLQAAKTDTQTTTTAGFVDVTGLSIAITPSAATSKILVLANVCTVGTVGAAASFTLIVRDSTEIAIGDAAGSRLRVSANGYAPDAGDNRHHSTVWLDSPSTTSATTYKVQFTANGTYTAYINRTQTDTDSNSYARSVSTITVMEIGA